MYINKILIFFSFLFFVSSCNNTVSSIDQTKPIFEEISFNVVQKKILLDEDLPSNLTHMLNYWFDNKVKIHGYEGDITFNIYEYSETISLIDDGKKVEVSITFDAIIRNPILSQKKIINGQVKSFGTISGNFTLSEFDTIIKNAQTDLVVRISRDLKSKI